MEHAGGMGSAIARPVIMETRVLLYAPEGELIRAMDEENKERAVARPAHAIAR